MKPIVSLSGYDPRDGARSDDVRREERRREALDITDQRRAEQRLLHVVRHDALTGLPNRAVLLERLQRGLQAARRGEGQAALLLMDVDRFKAINTGLGNAAGDGLLCEIARRVGGCVTPRDTLARYGEDGFAVLIEGVEEVEDAVRVARWLQRDL